jgi:hypothetical protein
MNAMPEFSVFGSAKVTRETTGSVLPSIFDASTTLTT